MFKFAPSLRISLLRASVLFLVSTRIVLAQSTIDLSINQSVWQQLYKVSASQINDPTWLAKDDDGDGVSNGDELKAGTNPFDPNSTFKNSTISMTAQGVSLTVPTVAGKLYVLQSTTNLKDATTWTAFSPSVQAIGKGTPLTLSATANFSKNTFYRVTVQDVDSDGDQVSDWAEIALGFDPNNSHTNGSAVDDHTAILNQLAQQVVTTISVKATKATATEPPAGVIASDIATITFTRSSSTNLNALTVPLTWGGTAVPGVDYTAELSSVTFPANTTSTAVSIVPLVNPKLLAGVTVTVKLSPGSAYTVGSTGSASAVIFPAGSPKGTGLTATYFNGTVATRNTPSSVATYSDALFSGTPALTRLDPTVDFNWASGSPGTGVNPTYFVANWQGLIQPEYSEIYFFDVLSDDGVKLWVNDQLIIDGWLPNGNNRNGVERRGSIALKAGVLYDFKLQYYQGNGTDFIHLNWYSASQAEQIVPSTRLYPLGSSLFKSPPAISSATMALAFLNQPFNFTVTASSLGAQPITFALASTSGPLPPGLTLDPNSGLISGTPTTVGDYPLALTATNGSGVGAAFLDLQVLPVGSGVTRELWTGLAGTNISDLPLATKPSSIDTNLNSLEDLGAYPNNNGERLRGYFTAPATGNYYFWLAASNVAEFWLSNNADPVNLMRRAWVKAPGTGLEQWGLTTQPKQRSPWLALVQGKRYYFEVLHNTGASGAKSNLSVAYLLDPTGAASAPTTPSSVLPGFLLTQFDYPTISTSPGTVYTTNLSPLVGTGSSGSGSATMRLSADQTQVLLHFNYGNLSSPQTSYAIYGPDDHGTEAILYDINAIDRFAPSLKTSDGGYIWNIAGSSAVSAATALGDILNGTASLEVQTVKNPAGEISGKFYLLRGSQQAPIYVPASSYADDHKTDAGAARFLNQAAFGAAPGDLSSVQSVGYAKWISNQLALPATHLTPNFSFLASYASYNGNSAGRVPSVWWQAAVTAPDQLRQRVAFALSEILVVSTEDDAFNYIGNSLTSYYDVLEDGAFGNFRDLLKAVTLHPAMGLFLNMQGNKAGSLATGYHPNENYAREIMQLFSIGLNRLWPDGTLVLDSQGNPVPTYTQDTITNGFARVFTGWNWNQPLQLNGQLPTNFNPSSNNVLPMVMVKGYHELGAKTLLDNVVLPPAAGYNPLGNTPGSPADSTTAAYDSYCLGDLDQGIDNLFQNPNVGPFICRQLIQRLVEGNPSPAYIYRVSQVFNDDGTSAHVRGNLAAVIRAILLDSEARDLSFATNSVSAGKQREPLLRIVAPARTFLASPNHGTYAQTGTSIITITTTNPHRFSPGDSVWLDFSVNATGSPAVEPFNDPVTTTFNILTTPTANTFTVHSPETVVVGCTEAAGSTTLLIGYNSAPSTGGKVYLHFENHSLPDGPYTITSHPDSRHFAVTTPNPAPSTGITDVVDIPRGGTTEFTARGVTNFTIATDQNNYLQVGDHFWLDTGTSNLKKNEWVISSVNGIRNYGVASTVDHGGQTVIDTSIFPLVPPPTVRSGLVNLPGSTFALGATGGDLAQSPLAAPTVFNYFYPDYKYPGSIAAHNIVTPEFQLTTDSNIVNLTNAVFSAILGSGNTDGLSSYRGAVSFDYSTYLKPPYVTVKTVTTTVGLNVTAVTTTTVDAVTLVNKLGDLLTGGMLTPETKNRIVTLLNDPVSFPPTTVKGTLTDPPIPLTLPTISARDQVREAIQLILTSSEYAIQR